MLEKDETLPVFDYGSLNQNHQDAAIEIAALLREKGHKELADLIVQRFKLVEIPKYDPNESVFVQACKIAGIYVAIQGHLQEGEPPNVIQYPLVALCGDIREFEKLVGVIRAMELNAQDS